MIPPHRITRLRRQGERYFADGLRELPDNRRLAILAVCAVEWEMFLVRRGGGNPRPGRRQNVSRSRPCLRSAARGRDGRGPRVAPGIRRAGACADRRAGHRRDPRRGDCGRSWMGGSRRPCRQGDRPHEHGRVGSVESRLGGLQPLPPLHAANAAHAGHRGVAGGRSPCWKRSASAQRWHGAADRLPAAEFEVEPAAAHPIPCGTRSAPATSGWRGRAATPNRIPPGYSLIPEGPRPSMVTPRSSARAAATAACRSSALISSARMSRNSRARP